MQHAGTAGLLDRGRELAELEALLAAAGAGQGRLVLIEGPPGIGKTRLAQAAAEGARERDMAALCARASELDRDFPFGVMRQLFEPLLLAAGGSDRAALLRGAAGRAAALFDPVALVSGPAPEASWAHFHALYWLVANVAEARPAVLVVDDLQWADVGSLQFLQFLLPRLAELAVLVVVTTRPSRTDAGRQVIDALATDPATVVLRPAPLSARAVAALVSGELGDAEPGFSDACREATGGNPFLLRELLRGLRDDAVVPSDEHAPLVRQLAPATVARAVVLRLVRLGDDAAILARAVAVLGDGTPVRRAAALARLPDERADELASALAQADILSAQRPLAFAHPILRAAVYADIDPGERSRVHREAARLLAGDGAGPDAIGVHLLATEPAGDPDAAITLREAATRALARGAAGTAVACLRRALAEPPASAERGGLALELAEAELAAGEPVAAAEHFEVGLRAGADVRTRARYVPRQVLALQALGRHDESLQLLEGVAEEAALVDPDLALSIEADLIASATLERSRRAWALRRLQRYEDHLTAATPAGRKLVATRTALDAFSATCDTPAGELADSAEAAMAGGQLLQESRSTPFYFAIVVLVLADREEPARRILDRAIEDARREGSAPAYVFAIGWRCWLLARQGCLLEAEADARSCAELALAQGWFQHGPVILGYVLDVLVDRGELDDALRLLELSGMATRTADQDATFDDVVHARARVRAARGDLAGARADFAELAGRRARWNTYPTLVPPVFVGPQLITADERDASRARGERMLRDARLWGTPRAIGMALRALALLEGGEHAVERLQEATAVLEGSPARLEQARALTDLGAALRAANRRVAARDVLRRALDLAHACGARPLAERARQELLAAGGRPRRPRVSGADALTASERRITAMAADGMSNPEIAQALFITTKTVEAHLSNAYRKLDIRSRTQLRGALEGYRA